MEDRRSPHDPFFRRHTADPGTAADFLRQYRPAEVGEALDPEKVELRPGTYVDEELRERRSDLLFRVGLRGGGDAFVYVLLEHKSRPDRRVALPGSAP